MNNFKDFLKDFSLFAHPKWLLFVTFEYFHDFPQEILRAWGARASYLWKSPSRFRRIEEKHKIHERVSWKSHYCYVCATNNAQTYKWQYSNFWKVVDMMTDQQRHQFLSFTTGSDRAPVGGLAALEPPLVIERHGDDDERLIYLCLILIVPQTANCFNML